MAPLSPWSILTFFGVLMTLLAWVARRFFFPPAQRNDTAEQGGRPERKPLPSWGVTWSAWAFRRVSALLKGRGSLWAGLSILLVGFAVSLTLSFARHFELDPLRAERLAKEGHASLTLNQEKLVPPPPLPPSLFIGTERVDLETADRDWSKLSPEFTQAILKLFARMEKRGFPLALLEGYRSPQRQDNLASMGGHVTHARAYQSKHQFGLAADIAPLREGKLVISERDPWAFKAYQALGEEAEAMELGWGGLWAPRDLGHIETSLTLAEIKKQKGFPA